MAVEFNGAYGGSSDWPKASLDILDPTGDHICRNVEELRASIESIGWTVEYFKTKDCYKLALNSGNYDWMADL